MTSSPGKAYPRVQAAWLSGPRFDLGFVVGIALLAAALSLCTVRDPDLFWPVLTLHTWLFGYEHLVATYTRLLVHPADRARFRTLTLLAPPLMLAGLAAVGLRYGLRGIYALYFVGQWHHTVRQSWGLAQQYRRKAGGLPWDSPLWSQVTMWSVPLWGLLHRCAQRPSEFLFQPFALPPCPSWLVTLGALASGLLWLHFAATRMAAYRRGELALGHTLYMVSHLLVFLGGYVLIDELCSGWLLVNVWHNVQYIVFVWLYNRWRFAHGLDPQARLLSWLSQPGSLRAVLYGLASIALALPLYYLLPRLGLLVDRFLVDAAVPAALTIGLTFTFHHYLVDALIWKRPRTEPPAAR